MNPIFLALNKVSGLYQPKGDCFMRRYEIIFIVDPDTGEDRRENLFQRINEIINRLNGYVVFFDEWGVRSMAYDVKGKSRGYYVRLDVCGDGTLVDEVERFFRIDERVLKYLSVLLDKDVDMEKIRQEQEEAEKKKIESAEETSSETEDAGTASSETSSETEDAGTASAEAEPSGETESEESTETETVEESAVETENVEPQTEEEDK
jgi:small subunit ribosomal protein S6